MTNDDKPPSSGARARARKGPQCFELRISRSGLRECSFYAAEPIRQPSIWLQAIDPCPGLWVMSFECAGVEQLAEPSSGAPAYLFEKVETALLLPALRTGERLKVGFANRSAVATYVRVWFGEPLQLLEQWREELGRGWRRP